MKIGTNRIPLLRSLGLWRWYINIAVTILDSIHRPVFYLKHDVSCRCVKQKNVNKIYVWPYFTGNTLRLRYESNRLMLSIGLWRWYVNITATILDTIHRPVFYLKQGVSETGFCLGLEVIPTGFGLGAGYHLKKETEFSLWNVVFTGRLIMSSYSSCFVWNSLNFINVAICFRFDFMHLLLGYHFKLE
jgi:hypothetical protein